MSGTKLVITDAGNWKQGRRLRSIWAAVGLQQDDDEGPAALVLIAEAPTITAFLTEVGGAGILVCGDPRDVLIAVIGSWPFARAREYVLMINSATSHPGMWARALLHKVLPDPNRHPPEMLSEELVESLTTSFKDALLRSVTDG